MKTWNATEIMILRYANINNANQSVGTVSYPEDSKIVMMEIPYRMMGVINVNSSVVQDVKLVLTLYVKNVRLDGFQKKDVKLYAVMAQFSGQKSVMIQMKSNLTDASNYCDLCNQGICEQCLNGWHLYDLSCQSKCGDGILVPLNEQCDDANTSDWDGCNSECQFEAGWLCIQNHYQITKCLFGNNPKMQLTSIKIGRTSEVSVSFSQELQFNSPVDQNRNPIDFFGAYLKIKQQETYKIGQLNNLQLTIEIQFLQPIEQVILNVQVQDVFENQYEQGFLNLEESIRITPPQLLSQQVLQVVAVTAQQNFYVMYSLIGLSVLSMLMGNMDIFWNLLEQLQLLSYLRYINVKYPENLDIFLNIFSIISIQPLMDFFNFETILTKIHFGEIPVIDSVGKFQNDEGNSYFIVNIASTVIIFITAFLGYCLCSLVIKVFNPITIDHKFEQLISKLKFIDQVKWRARLLRLNRFLLKTCFKTFNYFFYSELIRIYISSSYDIILSTMLQIAEPKFDDFPMQLSYVFKEITLFSTFSLILFFQKIISSPYPKKHKLCQFLEIQNKIMPMPNNITYSN